MNNDLLGDKYNQFISDPTKNPFTGRAIRAGGPIFKDLAKRAQDYYGLTLSMDIELCTLLTNKYTLLDIDNETYGVDQKQQRSNEDRYRIERIGPFRYFAVFDGHGGAGLYRIKVIAAVDYCVQNLHIRIAKGLDGVDLSNSNEVISNLKTIIVNFDTEMYNNNIEGGTTIGIVLIDDCHDLIYQINVGDTRSIIFNDNRVISVTKDHKPHYKSECDRIKKADGIVQKWNTIYRLTTPLLGGGIAISRALGDFEFKFNKDILYDPINGALSAVPDIKVRPKCPGYILITSDAPFENNVYNNKTLVEIASSLLHTFGIQMPSIQDVVETMVDTISDNYKITDDITLMISLI